MKEMIRWTILSYALTICVGFSNIALCCRINDLAERVRLYERIENATTIRERETALKKLYELNNKELKAMTINEQKIKDEYQDGKL